MTVRAWPRSVKHWRQRMAGGEYCREKALTPMLPTREAVFFGPLEIFSRGDQCDLGSGLLNESLGGAAAYCPK